MLLPVAQKVAQHQGLRSGKTTTPSVETLPGRHKPSGEIFFANPEKRFNPATRVSTFSSTHICLALLDPTKNPRWRVPSQWMHYNGDVAFLAASYDTPRAHTKFYFSSLRYHDWINTGYSPRTFSVSTENLISLINMDMGSPWFTPSLISRASLSNSLGLWTRSFMR